MAVKIDYKALASGSGKKSDEILADIYKSKGIAANPATTSQSQSILSEIYKEHDIRPSTYSSNQSESDRILYDIYKKNNIVNPGAVNVDYVNRFLFDADKYISGNESDSAKLGFLNAAGIFNSRKATSDDLAYQASNIRAWLSNDQNDIPEGWKDLGKYLDAFDTWNQEQIGWYQQKKDLYGQYASQEEYDQAQAEYEEWLKQQERNEYLVGLDTVEARQRIEEMDQALIDWQEEQDGVLDFNDQQVLADYNQYITDRMAEIEQLKMDVNLAEFRQEGIRLGEAVNNEDFQQFSGYQNSRDDQYNFINNIGGVREREAQVREDALSRGDWALEGAYTQKGYDLMTDQEVSLYNYYYNKEGRKAAQAYLDSLQETLNYRRAENLYAGVDGTIGQLTYAFEAGLDQFGSGLDSSWKMLTGDEGYIPPSAYQIAAGQVRQDVAEKGIGYQIAYDTISSTANMLPSILTSTVVNAIAPGAGLLGGKITFGALAGSGMMGASAAGHGYQEMLNLGYSKDQARAYGLLVGGSEVALGELIGGISKLGGIATGAHITALLKNVDNAFARVAIDLGSNIASEFTEEYLQDVLEPWYRNLITGENNKVDFLDPEALYSGLLGALTAGLLEGPGTVFQNAGYYTAGNELRNSGVTNEQIRELGQMFDADTQAFRISGRVSENTGAYTIGRLYNEIGATLTEQNVQEISQRLQERGWDKRTADKNAQLMAQVIEGSRMPEAVAAMMDRNTTFGEVMREFSQEDSSVRQRTGAFQALGNRIRPQVDSYERAVKEYTGEAAPGDRFAGTDIPVNLQTVKEVRDGEIIFEAEDGLELKANEVDFADSDEAVLVQTMQELGLDKSAVTAMMQEYRTMEGQGKADYAKAVQDVKTYAQMGIPYKAIRDSVYGSRLGEGTRRAVYDKVRAARDTEMLGSIAAQAATNKSGTPGKVHFERGNRILSSTQSTAIRTMEQLATITGADFYVYESTKRGGKRYIQDKDGNWVNAPHGWYDPKDGSIHIDLYAGDVEGTMLFTMSHELTHFIKDSNLKQYGVLKDTLLEGLADKGVNIQELIEKKIAANRAVGNNLSYEGALDEVVADAMESMLTDGTVMQTLEKIHKQDASLYQKIVGWVRDFIQDIQNLIDAYAGREANTEEGKMVQEMEDLRSKLQKTFAEALSGTSLKENQAVREETPAKRTFDPNARYEDAQRAQTPAQDAQKPAREAGIRAEEKPAQEAVVTREEAKPEETLGSGRSLGPLNMHYQSINPANSFLTAKEGSGGFTRYEDGTVEPVISRSVNELKGWQANGLLHLFDIEVNGKIFKEGDTLPGGYYRIGEVVSRAAVNEKHRDYFQVTQKGLLRMEDASKKNTTGAENKNTAPGDGVKYSIRQYSEQQKENWKDSKKIVVYEDNSQLLRFVNRSISDKNFTKKLYFGMVPDDLATRILQETGIDVSGKNLSLAGNEIRKIVKDHGRESTEAPRGQVAIKEEDFALILDVVQAPDEVKRGYNYNGGPAILFSKNIDGKTTVVTWTTDGSKDLHVQTMYRGKNKGSIPTVLGAVNGFPNTSETTDGTASNKMVTQETPVVKQQKQERTGAENWEPLADTLSEENRAIGEDAKELKKLMTMLRQVKGGVDFTRSSVESMAKYLMKEAGASGNSKDFADILHGVYGYLSWAEDLSWENIQLATRDAGKWLKDHQKKQRDAYSQEVLSAIRGRTISLDAEQKGEADFQFGSYDGFRKSLFGSVNFSDSGIPLDIVWQEWSGKFPSVFPPDATSTDMPALLFDIIEGAKNGQDLSGIGDLMGQQDLMRQIYDSFWKITALKTASDANRKEINRIRSQHATRMEDLKRKHRASRTELQEEYRQSVKAVREEYKAKLDQQHRDMVRRHQESRSRGAESRKMTAQKAKIRKTVLELRRLLERGTRERNVKEGLKDFVTRALSTADVLMTESYSDNDIIRYGFRFETLTDQEQKWADEAQEILKKLGNLPEGSYEAYRQRQEQEAALKSQLSYRAGKLRDVISRERIAMGKVTGEQMLTELSNAYAQLKESRDSYISGAYIEGVHSYLESLKDSIGGARVKDMTLGQLEELGQAYTMVMTTVKNANRMFSEELKADRVQLGNDTIKEITQSGKRYRLGSGIGAKAAKYAWDNLKPIYAADRVGSKTFRKLMQGIFDGQYQWARDIQEATQFQAEQAEKFNLKDWDRKAKNTFTSATGQEFSLTLDQIMSIYAYSRRDASHSHLTKGGFTFGTDNKGRKIQNATAYQLNDSIIGDIVNSLTVEQKGYVEAMQKYLSQTMGGKGNEVSMKLFGIKLFGEENYFPIRSSGEYMARAKEAEFRQEQGQINIVNSGFTKATVPEAGNPMILDGFMDVWADHVNQMSTYHGMVLPMEDFRKVYNFSTPNLEGQQSQSVNAAMNNAFSNAATKYFDQLYKELNSGAMIDPRENFFSKATSLFKKGAVVGSMSVVVQQPSAIGRAFSLVNPKYFVGTPKNVGRNWEQLKKYGSVAIIKEIGGFDTHAGLGVKDYILGGKGRNVLEKLDDKLGWAPEKADQITWLAIWDAVKRETKAKHRDIDVNSEAFLKLAGKRFNEVIEYTQVYDSTLSRSALMRGKTNYLQMLTAFMAEPTTTINMVEDAFRSGNVKKILTTIGGVGISILINNLMASLVYAARDDDEDETWWEKYAQSFADSMKDDLNILTYLPYIKDIWSTFQGYDVMRSDLSIASTLKTAWDTFDRIRSKDTADMTEEELSQWNADLWKGMYGLVEAAAGIVGIPMKNLRRDIMAIGNLSQTVYLDITQRDTTRLSLADAVHGDDKKKQDKLYDAILAGDEAYVERLKNSYSSDSSYHTAIRNALRDRDPRIRQAAEAKLRGDLAEYDRISEEIIGEANFERADIVKALDSEVKKLLEKEQSEPSDPKPVSLYGTEDLITAAIQGDWEIGNNVQYNIVQAYQDTGKGFKEATESLHENVREACKETFLEGGMDAATARQVLIRYGGKTEEEAGNILEDWEFRKEWGFEHGSRISQYKEGAITSEQLAQIMVDDGYTREDALAQIEVYNWEMEGWDMATVERIQKYKEYCAPAGVSKEMFFQIQAFSAETKNDVDENGKTIYYSAMKKVMAKINSLNISAKQKDALARSLGWSEKNIGKYKLW